MKTLVTGGAGFNGRWLVKRLLGAGHHVVSIDDYSNGRAENLRELESYPNFAGAVKCDIKDSKALHAVFARERWDFVFHLAASIHVQKSFDDPTPTFEN